MRTNQIKMLGATAVAMAMAASCTSTKLFVRPGSTPPNPASDKFLIMPVDIHGLPGDKTAQEAALFAGFVAAFQEQGVPLQPIKPALEAVGLNNLSWTLAEGMYHLVSFHEVYDFKEDAGFHGGSSEYQLVLDGAAKLVEVVAEQLKLDFKPKYVAVAHIDSTGSPIPNTIGYRVIGGIYNLEEQKIDQVIWYEQKTAAEDAAVLAEMGTLGSKLYGLLLAQEKTEEKK